MGLIKVGYDAGHGLNTPGKRTPDGEREWTFNNIVAKAFANELALYDGVASKRFDDSTGKTDVSLQKRTDGANAWGADYYISFHHNALAGKWGNHTGVETFYSKGSTKGLALAKAIHPAVVKAYGLANRGLKNSSLHITRETKMPAILVEGGFMDSLTDIKKLRDEKVLKAAGVAIAQAFAEHVGLKRVVSVSKKARKRHNVRVYWFNSDSTGGIAELKKYLDSKDLDYKITQSNGKYMLESYWYTQTSKNKQALEEWLHKKSFNYDIQLEK